MFNGPDKLDTTWKRHWNRPVIQEINSKQNQFSKKKKEISLSHMVIYGTWCFSSQLYKIYFECIPKYQ
jgi:hypothetical protein